MIKISVIIATMILTLVCPFIGIPFALVGVWMVATGRVSV